MRKQFFIVLSFIIFFNYSCSDGNVITVELNFDETFQSCGKTDLVFYKTKTNPTESISLLISNFTLDEILVVDANNSFNAEKAGTFYYRTYNDATLPTNLFCSDIPPNVSISLDESDAVNVIINTLLTEDDNDGVIASLEDLNGNGILTDDDTDGDGLPNYIDADDDGDNVLTANENPDPNGDGNLNDAQDSDGDLIPDYLDSDDDGDGVLTRNEENYSQDNNPANDITNPNIGPDYLNPEVATSVQATSFREHKIIQTYTVTVNVTGISLTFLSQSNLYFGVLNDGKLSDFRTVTPPFN